MISTIASLIEDLQHHPIVQDPIPPMSTFTNTPAYRLFLQLRNTLRHLINTTHDAQRGLNRLQFIPGSPGSPGHYRIDPTLTIPPQQTNYLSAAALQHTTAIPPPTDTPPLIRQLRCRDRSRSRDRLPLTTPSQPNHTTHHHQTAPDQSPAAHGHRGQLHQALWTASNSSAAYHMTAGTLFPPFDAAPATLCLTLHVPLRIKNPRNKLHSYIFNLTFQHSLTSAAI